MHRDKGLQVIYIGHQDRIEKLVPYAKANRLPDFYFDPDDSASARFGMTYGAGVVFVNSSGVIVSRIPKGVSSEVVKEELTRIIDR